MTQQHSNGGQTALTNQTQDSLRQIQQSLDQLISQVRQSIGAAQEPKAQALFETTAEVLIGLRKAYEDYTKGGEKAWQ